MVSIRKAVPKDSERIASLIQEHLGRDYKPFGFNRGIIDEKMREKNNTFFVAVDGDRIIGTLRCSVVDFDLADIRWMVVDTGYREKGTGISMVKAALKHLKKIGMRKVLARTRADSMDSVRMFLKLGFNAEGYFREHYRKGTDIIQFSIFLQS